jgi:hypothetical protein
MALTIFPSILPDDETYSRQELMEMCEASTLQGIAAAHTTSKVDGQSSAIEIADFLSGNHTTAEVDGILEIIRNSEPPRSEVELAPALNDNGNLARY